MLNNNIILKICIENQIYKTTSITSILTITSSGEIFNQYSVSS